MKSIDHYLKSAVNKSFFYYNQLKGFNTSRRIVVIESDDWGSIRMPNRETYERSLKKGIRVDKCSFCRNDTLASVDDFDALYNVLLKYKDINNNFPVITANTIVGNPNFEKILNNNYEEYHYELFTDTIKKYQNCSFDLWKQGMSEEIFYPQLHGREHLSIDRWLKALKRGSEEMLFAFENKYFGISSTISNEKNPSFMAAFDYDDDDGKQLALKSVEEAPLIFKEIFGYKSKSFIAPNYIWDKDIEEVLMTKDIKFLQGSFLSKTANQGNQYLYIGKKNKFNQIYTARNVIFEPASQNKKDLISTVIKQIDRAFRLKKPAIISSHRVNFIGGIFEDNRTENLKLLDQLIKEILIQWPNIEFMHSADLGELIKENIE